MRITDILVPIDFGTAADRALDIAVILAEKLGARLLLLHAYEANKIVYADESSGLVMYTRTDDRREFESFAKRFQAQRYPNSAAIWLEGDPRNIIPEAASARHAGLVVMGTHGRGNIATKFFGSVASRLVRTSPVPLITTRAAADDAPTRLKHLLVATDFGPPAARALRFGAELAERLGARLTVLHACPYPYRGFDESEGWRFPAMVREAKSLLDEQLREARAIVKDARGLFVYGDARDQILEVSREEGVDLVVMGTHARRGLSRTFLGSVAEAVVRASSIPVLTLSGAEDEQAVQ